MKASAFKIFTIFLILSILGVFILPKLSVRLNPSNNLPSINVNYTWPYASAYIVERDITSKLETGLSTLDGLKNLSSKSSKGTGYITLSFDKYTNVDIARFEVAAIIRQLYSELPKQSSYPTINVNRPDQEEIKAFLSYSINASDSPSKIQKTVRSQIEPKIASINNIYKTEVFGANPSEFVFYYNTEALKTFKISKREIISIVQQFFKNQSLGYIHYNEKNIALSIQNRKDNIDWHIPIHKLDNRLLYLDDLMIIKEQEQETQNYYRINGNNSITLNLYATKAANTIKLVSEVDKRIDIIKAFLPETYSIVKTYDSANYLNQELYKIYQRSLYTIVILLAFIYLISSSSKYLLITVISLIVNICITFLLYYALKVEIQLYSLAGITISLGLILDNIIVMIDHIRNYNNKYIFVPILASTLTTTGALSVIYFLDDAYKVNLIDFALVIIINLSVSLVTALFLIPMLMEKLRIPIRKEKLWIRKFKTRFYKKYKYLIWFGLKFKRTFIILIILAFGLPFFMLPVRMENNNKWYEKIYNSTVGSEWSKENFRPIFDRYVGGSFRLFSNYVYENSFYINNEETKLHIRASMEKGASIQQMNEVFLELENYLQQFSEIKEYRSFVFSSNNARIEISFNEEFVQTSFPHTLKLKLIHKVHDFGGIEWNISGVGNGFSNEKGNNELISFSVRAKGYNYDQLNNWADSLKVILETHPRIQNVVVRENTFWSQKPSYEYHLLLDKEKLALAKIDPSNFIDKLHQLTISKYHDLSLNIKGKYTPLRFESTQSKKFDLWHIKNTPLDSLNTPKTLKDIATVVKNKEEESIYKENQEYIRLIEFKYTGALKYGSSYLDKTLKELKLKLPLGYKFERPKSQNFFSKEKNSHYILLLILVFTIIYFICVILFESLKQPFIILSVIPISFIGVFLTFYLFGFNFDQGGLASFVLLSGITVNASIFIIDGFNKLKKQFSNENRLVLYLEAFKQKIFPIMLTIISTILGFIPFIIDGQNEVFWFALGVGTIGGLTFSLIAILFYLPIFTLKSKN